MTLPKFKALLPKTLEEALEMKAEFGDRACIYAGGTDVLIRMKRGLLNPEYVIYIGGIEELFVLEFDDHEGLRIGACATLSDISEMKEVRVFYPALFTAVTQMATTQVRNKATLVGNICNAAPSADTAPPLIAYGAQVTVVSKDGERIVPLEEFFLGPGRTALLPDEIVKDVVVPVQEEGSFATYVKFSHRSNVDIAVVGVSSKVVRDGNLCKDVRVVLGAVAPTPMRAKRAEDHVRGKEGSPSLFKEAGRIASEEARPITDIRGTKEYRRYLVGVLTERSLSFSFNRAAG